jgi:hypothetical protein
MRAALGSALLLASVTCGLAETPIIDFSGQTYHLDYQDRAKPTDGRLGDGIAEFTLQGETVNDWTKLFAFHAYPEAGDNPALAASTLGRIVQEANKDARFALTEDPQTGEAIVDFLTWAPGGDVMEFNVFNMGAPPTGRASSPCSMRSGSRRTTWPLPISPRCASARSRRWPIPTSGPRATTSPTRRARSNCSTKRRARRTIS